jgi:hypothetical protein
MQQQQQQQQDDRITFEALPQRVDANKAKRRRKGDSPAAAAADGGQGNPAPAPAAAVAAAAAGQAGFSTGFGLHNIGQQQLEGHETQQQQHIEDAGQYRSAAVGENKFECEWVCVCVWVCVLGGVGGGVHPQGGGTRAWWKGGHLQEGVRGDTCRRG